MPANLSPLQSLREELAPSSTAPSTIAFRFAANANSNASRNTYITPYTAESLHRAEQLPHLFPNAKSRPPLYGIPISIKDCFDVAGSVTTCASRFYAQHNPVATKNSWVAQRLLDAGAILTGKTHLHQLAYGSQAKTPTTATASNPATPPCSPAAPPAAPLPACRKAPPSQQSAPTPAAPSASPPRSAASPATAPPTPSPRPKTESHWAGGYHLAQSFDTIGLLFRDLRDAAPLANAIFDIATRPMPCHRSHRLHWRRLPPRLRLQRSHRLQRLEATPRAARRNPLHLRPQLLVRRLRHLLPHRRQRSRSHPPRTLPPLRTRHRRTPRLRSIHTPSRNPGLARAPQSISPSDVRSLRRFRLPHRSVRSHQQTPRRPGPH